MIVMGKSITKCRIYNIDVEVELNTNLTVAPDEFVYRIGLGDTYISLTQNEWDKLADTIDKSINFCKLVISSE